ncbi:MAG: hypothetical protein ACREP3_13420 [Candidatus Binatia bacterium]
MVDFLETAPVLETDFDLYFYILDTYALEKFLDWCGMRDKDHHFILQLNNTKVVYSARKCTHFWFTRAFTRDLFETYLLELRGPSLGGGDGYEKSKQIEVIDGR